MKVESGYLYAFILGNAVWVTVLTKKVSGDLFVPIQGDVNVVPGVVSPSSVSHDFSSVYSVYLRMEFLPPRLLPGRNCSFREIL